ncbi:hypothetical protein ACVJBD_002378 [Rhizobium mongolense]
MWLYVPNISTSSPSAQAEEASISASSWQFKALEQSVWWRGKPSQSRHWYQRWSKASFIRLLCGLMPEPSTAAHGVAQLTASLVASRVSLTALPVSASAKTTSETSGRQPVASSSSQACGSSSSRTSAACSHRAVPSVSGETFADWASRLREDCSRRQKSARAMSVKGSSSSQWPSSWPTAAVTDSFGARNRTAWRSNPDSKHHDGVTLNDAIVLWATPTQVHRKSEKAMRPFADGGQSSPPAIEQQAETLTNTLWATPSVADTSGGRMTRSGDRSNEPLLKGQSDALSSRLDPMIYPVGQVSSHPRRSLNPLFVEWLMGWPPGWTLAAWTDFACSVTELSLWKQRMRSVLLQLGLPQEAPPAQLALFG